MPMVVPSAPRAEPATALAASAIQAAASAIQAAVSAIQAAASAKVAPLRRGAPSLPVAASRKAEALQVGQVPAKAARAEALDSLGPPERAVRA